MVIAVNTRLLLKGRLEGIGNFAYHTLYRIVKSHPEHTFVFIFDRQFSDEFVFAPNIVPVIASPPARHPVLWYLFFEWSVPRILRKYKADLFFSPDGWLSLSTPVKSVPVIHDLNFFHYPQFISGRLVRKYYHYFFPRFIKKAERVVTVSEFSRRDIFDLTGFDQKKIDVVYNGAIESLGPLDELEKKSMRQKYTGGAEYFLFIGLIHPRKNAMGLMRAFNLFRQANSTDLKLVFAGDFKYMDEQTRYVYENSAFRKDIIFTGRLPEEELHQLLASAMALVYPSFFEGFGIPVLEAMYCNVPVIASNVTSIPEVGGDAVLYIDPFDDNSISNAMREISSNPQLRQKLIAGGITRKEKFSWDKTAIRLWESLEKAMG